MICFFSSLRHTVLRTTGIVAALLIPGHAAVGVIGSPSQAAVNAAIGTALIKYNRSYTNGAFTNGAWFGGASIVLAVSSYAGNTSSDARLLEQIRYSCTGGNEIVANGGYPAQHERHATGMFAIARQTPRIWNQLTTAEKTRIDLIMKAALVASAFTTCNTSLYIGANQTQRTLDGDSNLGRDWNPNYREGMLGGMLVSMVYFGGPDPANAILNSYNHAQFLSQLSANGLTNLYTTFNWNAANPSAVAPTGAQIESSVRNYKYYLSGLSDYMGLYTSLVNDTYGKNVTPGLNNGAGINGWGALVSGADTLPNRGALGMLKEFDSSDGGGARSAIDYAYDGFRPHQTNQLVLIIGGFWQKGSAPTESAVARMKVGNTDLWYKMGKGYYDWAKASPQGMKDLASFNKDKGFTYVRSLWEDVLLPYHNSSVEPEPDPEQDTDSDGTTDVIERRLGLDPANPSSRFYASVASASSEIVWPSATGLTFVVQRSTGTTDLNWETIATVTGSSGVSRFTDPSPPEGSAFYRVGLNP